LVLVGVRCPTLVLVGSEDIWSSIEQHRAIAELIPRAQLKVINGAGHMMPAESPEVMNSIVKAWVQTEHVQASAIASEINHLEASRVSADRRRH